MNTVYKLKAVDSEAFRVAIQDAHQIDGAEEINTLEEDELACIEVYYSRVAMSPMGFRLGCEYVTVRFPCFRKDDLGIVGFPKELNAHVVLLGVWEIYERNSPEPEKCENGCEEDECECELYFPPDDDFFYSEIDHIVDMLGTYKSYPEAEFDREERMWSLGDKECWLGDKEVAHADK